MIHINTLYFFLPCIWIYIVFVVYAERKLSAYIQDRYGPQETGFLGLWQTVADFIKIIQKEDLMPDTADKWLYRLAPVVVFMSVFMGFSVIPLSSVWSGAPVSSGLFFFIAILSIDVVGVFMTGWASHSKYASLGAIRVMLQMFSYEVPLGLSALCLASYCGTIDLLDISVQQGGNGFLTWNIFQAPLLILVWIIFFISSLAQSHRSPFDLPEAESELVAGFQVEYSGIRWAFLMMSEYMMIFVLSILGVVLFFGSFNSPLPNMGTLPLYHWTTGTSIVAMTCWGIFWLISKTLFFVFVQLWIRWTFPRLRMDQLLRLCWKYLTPSALIMLLIISARNL